MVQKIIDEGFIVGLVNGLHGSHGVEITAQEYNELTEIFHSMPVKEGFGYRLKTDLTWEEYKINPEPQDLIGDAEALDILLGGDGE